MQRSALFAPRITSGSFEHTFMDEFPWFLVAVDQQTGSTNLVSGSVNACLTRIASGFSPSPRANSFIISILPYSFRSHLECPRSCRNHRYVEVRLLIRTRLPSRRVGYSGCRRQGGKQLLTMTIFVASSALHR
jgi:hypothetical protein